MSQDYVGDNSSELTSSILESVSQLGSVAIQSTVGNPNNTNLSTPYYAAPVTNYGAMPLNRPFGMSWVVILFLAAVGYFAYQKL